MGANPKPITDPTPALAARRSMRWPPPPPGRVRWSWLLGTWVRRRLIRSLMRLAAPNVPDHAVVVDAGAGPGYDLDELERAGPGRIRLGVLLDPQRGMLERAQQRRGGSSAGPIVVVGDAAHLPVRDTSVDVVLSLGVFCCMTDSGADLASKEAFRVLRPGGRLVFAVPRWRGSVDDGRLARAGFARAASSRPGRGVFAKPL